MIFIKLIVPVLMAIQIMLDINTSADLSHIMPGAVKALSLTQINTVMLETTIFNQRAGNIDSVTGCGPTSAAMVLVSEKGLQLTKDEAVTTAYNNGFYYYAGVNFTSGVGVTQENIQSFIRYYGFDTEIDHLLTDSDDEIIRKINSHLNEGHRMILGHLARHKNRFLHYAVIYGKYTENGELYYNVADPWGGLESKWSRDDLLEQIDAVYATDSYSFQGMVKGIQWLV